MWKPFFHSSVDLTEYDAVPMQGREQAGYENGKQTKPHGGSDDEVHYYTQTKPSNIRETNKQEHVYSGNIIPCILYTVPSKSSRTKWKYFPTISRNTLLYNDKIQTIRIEIRPNETLGLIFDPYCLKPSITFC